MLEEDAKKAAILQSLELYAEEVGDPAYTIYQRFFSKYPEARELFGNDEGDYIKLRMMERVFSMIMELADGSLDINHSAYWITDHLAWGVGKAMVIDMFNIIFETIRDGLGKQWETEMEVAWCELMDEMTRVFGEQVAIYSNTDN